MTGGLLSLLNDPVFMAGLEVRRKLAATLANRWACSTETACHWLDHEDKAAMELFAIGNIIPRNILH